MADPQQQQQQPLPMGAYPGVAPGFPGMAPPMGPTSPVAPPQSPIPNDMMSMLMQQSQQAESQAQTQLGRAQATAPTPAMMQGLGPQGNPAIGVPGVGKLGPQLDSSRSPLYNFGQALLMALGTTRPGHAFEQQLYGGREAEREKKVEALQGQVKSAQEQQRIEEAPIGPLKQAEYRPFSGAMGAQARIYSAQSAAQTALQRIQSAQTIDERNNLMREYIANLNAETRTEDTRLAGVLRNAGIHDEVTIQQAIQSAHDQKAVDLQAAGFAEDPSLWGEVKRAIGITGVGTPAAGAPAEKPTTPAQQKKAGAVSQAQGAGEPPRPANVPPSYVYNARGPKGAGWYKPKPKGK